MIQYIAPPTCAAFAKSDAFGRLIAGPVGSGKTTACVIELLRRSIEQGHGNDGLRHTRFAIVRQTLKQLKDTVLKDCQSWLKGIGEFKVSENCFHLNFSDVRSEWIFIPLEDSEDQARLLSMQLTGAWLSEAIEMDISVLAPLSGRIGRYPSGQDGAATWQGMIADTNFPPEGSAWHKFMELDTPPGWQIFKQPSGLSVEAENLENLNQTEETRQLGFVQAPDGPDTPGVKYYWDNKIWKAHPKRIARGQLYYQRYVDMYGLESDWVKRYVRAEYGEDPSGTSVFKDCFKASFHVVDQTFLIPGYPILIGQDFGRDPWSVICQVDHLGRLVVHEEVPPWNSSVHVMQPELVGSVGLEIHIEKNLKPRLLSEKYLGHKVAIIGDPSGRNKSQISEETCFDAMKRMGLPAFGAPTNDIDTRLRAVEALLLRQSNGGPALMFNRKGCPTLIRALAGAYRYGKTRAGIRKPVPDKNEYSHVSDALQYAALAVHGGMSDYIASRLRPRTTGNRPKISALGWT